jgi:ribosomal protein S18 acetylase RimI-like enzyme
MPLTLRPAQPADEPFLFELYASTRAEELTAWGWDAAQRDLFLKLQFNGQQQHYRTHFAHADHSIVELDDQPIGRLIVARSEQEIHLADLIIQSAHRGSGIGTALIRALLAEAARSGKIVRLSVLRTNRATRLYQRLGFSIVADSETYVLMESRPLPPDTPDTPQE